MLKSCCLSVGVLCLLAAPALAQPAAVAAGLVKVASGEVFIVRGAVSLPASVGLEIHQDDLLRTGPDGRLGVTLKDDTRLALEPGSAVRIASFQYAPEAGKLALVLKFVSGAAAYVSGHIAKLSPDAVRLETPQAIVGVRGTTLAIRVGDQ